MKPEFIGPLVVVALIVLVLIILFKTARVVPQRQAFLVERLGKFSKTLEAGFHLLVPFVEIVAYKLSLKEEAMDVPPQLCITRDNVTVEVDGVLYLQVMEPDKAAYGIANYKWATIQLAQTTMRSLIGKIELDRTFEERDTINAGVVDAVDKASEPWGIKVTRYEIKNITPPSSIMDAMEKQMRAEREKRATIAESEGNRQARINVSEGLRQEAIMVSEGEKQKLINEAEGRSKQIELVAQATAKGFREVASSLREAGGLDAMNLRIAEKYIEEFGKLAKSNNTMILPSNVADLAGIVATLGRTFAEQSSVKSSSK
ncbi:paraslipin [bacterium]|nr:paraslipin [bacterium]RQV97718.1 MAG: paraslipin [bacterium]